MMFETLILEIALPVPMLRQVYFSIKKAMLFLIPLLVVFGGDFGGILEQKLIKISATIELSWKSGDMRFDR